MAILEQENMNFEDAISCIREDKKYETIRVEEPDLFKYKPLPLLQFIMPTFGPKTIIKTNKSLGIDKSTNPDFTLKNFYFAEKDKAEFTKHKLDALKKRRCRLNEKQLRETLDQRQKKSFFEPDGVLRQIQRFLGLRGALRAPDPVNLVRHSWLQSDNWSVWRPAVSVFLRAPTEDFGGHF